MILPARDWEQNGVSEDDVVVPQQNQIAVYTNSRNEVVIRQHDWPDDDTIILVAPENARRLCEAILRCTDYLLDGDHGDDHADHQPVPVPRRAPMTAAERKRRQREREHEPRDAMSRNVTRDRDIDRDAARDTNCTLIELPLAPPLEQDEDEEVLAG